VQQAVRDADPWELPVVAHRKNKDTQWLITMRAEDFLKLHKKYWTRLDEQMLQWKEVEK
jgi:hypothetical protein